MGVPVATTAAAFEAGTPVELFAPAVAAQIFKAQYVVTRDGRFAVHSLVEESSATPITLILNWAP
jgi:hypothetical protein